MKQLSVLIIFFTLYSCGGGGGGSSDTPNPDTPANNVAPIANAGSTINANENTTVSLNGSSSSDSDGNITSYEWVQTSGQTVVLSGENQAQAAFTAPEVDEEETLTFRLTVTDNDNATDTDTVNVVIANIPATANQAPVIVTETSIFADEFTTVTLDASASFDPDGDSLSYLWEGANGVIIPNLTNTDSAIATLELGASGSGSVSLQVTVTDSDQRSVTQHVIVWVANIGNIPPVANAGENNVVAINEETFISAFNSTDEDGSIIQYEWLQIAGPTVTLSHNTSPSPSFTPTEAGQLTFQLTVRDNDGGEDTDTVIITVDAANQVPVITPDGIIDQINYNELELVELSFDSVIDPDGTIVNYQWRQTSFDSVDITLEDADQATARFTAPELSDSIFITFVLDVTDNDGATISSTSLPIAIHPVEILPTADAGSDQSVDFSTVINLSSAESSDSDGTIVSHQWRQIAGESIVLNNADTATPNFVSPNTEATLGFEVTVTDNHNNTDTATMLVRVVGDRLGPIVKRFGSPGHLELTWNEIDGADSYNLYYAKNTTVDSTNYLAESSSVTVSNISQPYQIPAAFNDYQNTYFTIEAVQASTVLKSETTNTEILDVAINPDNEGGCIIEGQQVICWGLFSGEHPAYETINPRKVLVNSNILCVLDDTGVPCWSLNDFSTAPVLPTLINPIDIYITGGDICVLDETGRVCVGDTVNEDTLTGLTNPTQLASECVVDDTGLVCDEGHSLLVSAPNFTSAPDQVSAVYSNVFDDHHACALYENSVSCWGESFFMPLSDVPALTNPQQISAGTGHACAIDDSGVVCWGDNSDRGEQDAPVLTNPRKVVVGYYSSCAIDDNGLSCWGDQFLGFDQSLSNIDSMTLRHQNCALTGGSLVCESDSIHGRTIDFNTVSDYAIGNRHSCVIENGEVDCWGWSDVDANALTPPELTNPILVSVGTNFSCAVDDNGPQCWGQINSFDSPGINNINWLDSELDYTCVGNDTAIACWDRFGGFDTTNVPSFSELREVSFANDSLSSKHVCAIDGDALTCWQNNFNPELESTAPTFTNPSQLIVGRSHACAIETDEIVCWGGDYAGQASPPSVSNPSLLTVGSATSCAVDNDGLICWGYGAFSDFGWRLNPIF